MRPQAVPRRAEDDGCWFDDLNALLAEGLADADAGRVIDADVVFDELEARYLRAIGAARKRE